MKKRLQALAFIWLLLWTCLAFADSHQVKPTIWACDPGTVAYNCARLGLPMPVLAMPMWEGTGNKVYDYSGNQNHGTINGATWKVGNISFDGNNDYIGLGNVADLTLSQNNFTICALVKTSSESTQIIVGKQLTNTPYKGWTLTVRPDGTIRLRIYDGSDRDTSSSSTINDGQWYTVIVVYTQDFGGQIYINGVANGSASSFNASSWENDAVANIGAAADLSGAFMNGSIAGISIYGHALIPSQVVTLYNNPFGMFEPIRWPIWNYSGAAPPATFPQMIMVQ